MSLSKRAATCLFLLAGAFQGSRVKNHGAGPHDLKSSMTDMGLQMSSRPLPPKRSMSDPGLQQDSGKPLTPAQKEVETFLLDSDGSDSEDSRYVDLAREDSSMTNLRSSFTGGSLTSVDPYEALESQTVDRLSQRLNILQPLLAADMAIEGYQDEYEDPSEAVIMVRKFLRAHRSSSVIWTDVEPLMAYITHFTNLKRSRPGAATLSCSDAKTYIFVVTAWRLRAWFENLQHVKDLEGFASCTDRYAQDETCTVLETFQERCPDFDLEELKSERTAILQAYRNYLGKK